ncbi:hypothetical protein F2P81_003570 [Scophthalmus maximus]|uniref:Uncharacterized protein n=1 Tax=Scophthalmus maximus TaxID=52904 RepID=A0A6A4TQX1_SCOMX|nr:hypothetical protein F2P81_003570 [Scophthalmus maximus]
MGSIDSRPRVRKVAPCKSPQEEGGPLKPQWTLPGLLVDLEQPSGSLERKKTSLPPLKQEITLSSLSGHGLQRWGCPPVFYNRPDRTLWHQQNDSGKASGHRMGGFLEAQTALTQQAHRHRQAHLRRAREQRRRKIVYTANGRNANDQFTNLNSPTECG